MKRQPAFGVRNENVSGKEIDVKSARHEKILELIREYDIDTQEELAQKLLEAGFQVTQATVSRDIRALKLTKIAGQDGKVRYAILTEEPPVVLGDKYARVLKEGLVSATAARNLVVIRTVPGMAMGVAAALDALKLKEILGCIAGDDTIMCACRTDEEASRTAVRLAGEDYQEPV